MGCGASTNVKDSKLSPLKSSLKSKVTYSPPKTNSELPKSQKPPKQQLPQIFTFFDPIEVAKPNPLLTQSKSNSKLIKIKTARKSIHNPQALYQSLHSSKK